VQSPRGTGQTAGVSYRAEYLAAARRALRLLIKRHPSAYKTRRAVRLEVGWLHFLVCARTPARARRVSNVPGVRITWHPPPVDESRRRDGVEPPVENGERPCDNQSMTKAELHELVDRLPDGAIDGAAVLLGEISAGRIDPGQAWFWTPEWQEKEREADDDSSGSHYVLRHRCGVPSGPGRADEAARCRRVKFSRRWRDWDVPRRDRCDRCIRGR
jgi:hypothetical protein